MILLLLAAAIAPGFAPPDRALTYRIRDTFPARAQQVVTTSQTLSFTRSEGGVVARLAIVSQSVEASPEARDAANRLFGPLAGVATAVRLDARGRPAALIDADRPWAAFLASRAALRAKFDADPTLPPATLAKLHKTLDAETAPAKRDERLIYPFTKLLPPVVPALAPGDSANFQAMIQTPGGTLAADGSVTLLAADPATLRYRTLLTTAPIAPAQVRYSEVRTFTIDRATGLLLSAHEERSLLKPAGESLPITIEDIDRLP